MKDENQGDRGVRKSNRQRVPNAFYTEGINELKRAPRPARDPPKPARKRSIVYQDEAESDPQAMEEEKSEVLKDGVDWLPCKLPKSGTMIRVQFVVQQPEEPAPERSRPEPVKQAKKSDTSFDLLSLFQKAIENVNEEAPPQKSAESEPQPTLKQPKLRKDFSVAKQRRVQDMEGRITGVTLHEDRITIVHSKIGEAEFPVQQSQMQEEGPSLDEVEEWRRRIESTGLLGQISIFN